MKNIPFFSILCIILFGCSNPHDFSLPNADGCYHSRGSAPFSIDQGWFVFRAGGETKRSRLEQSRDNLGVYIIPKDPIVLVKIQDQNTFQISEYGMKIRPEGSALIFTFPKSGKKVLYTKRLGPCNLESE